MGLSLEDLRTALAQANVNQAKGQFRRAAAGVHHRRQRSTAFEQGISAADRRLSQRAPVQLSDVADVIDDAENVRQAAWMNDTPAVIVNIQRQPGANIIEVVDRVKELLPQLQSVAARAIHVTILTDRTTTIRASVKDVQFELMLTVALVVMVIFLFCATCRPRSFPASPCRCRSSARSA